MQGLKDTISRHWQGRFRYGIGFALGGGDINRYHNQEWVLSYHGPSFASAGTGHWPWFLFEAALQTGPLSSWHIGILGFTIGKVKLHTYDNETGELVGPDKDKYYFFFKGINHQQQELGEII